MVLHKGGICFLIGRSVSALTQEVQIAQMSNSSVSDLNLMEQSIKNRSEVDVESRRLQSQTCVLDTTTLDDLGTFSEFDVQMSGFSFAPSAQFDGAGWVLQAG